MKKKYDIEALEEGMRREQKRILDIIKKLRYNPNGIVYLKHIDADELIEKMRAKNGKRT